MPGDGAVTLRRTLDIFSTEHACQLPAYSITDSPDAAGLAPSYICSIPTLDGVGGDEVVPPLPVDVGVRAVELVPLAEAGPV